MTAILKVDTIQDTSGNNIINENAGTITIGKSGDTVNLASGATNNLGITMADQWRITASTNAGTSAVISTNWERVDNTNYSSLGTGLTESSGVFTFPSTGIYYIIMSAVIAQDAGDNSSNIAGEYYIDNVGTTGFLISCNLNGETSNGTGAFMINVTNTTTHKIRFSTSSFSGTTFVHGRTNDNFSFFTAIRLGDSQ